MATFTVSTKANKDAQAINTKLTVIMGSQATLEALALQALVVKVQGVWRKNGIPTEATIKMDDYAPGTRHGGTINVFEAVKTMTPEQRAALIAELQKQ